MSVASIWAWPPIVLGASCSIGSPGVLRYCSEGAIRRRSPTGEECWFAQPLHWHTSCLDRPTRDAIAATVGPERLPRQCRFGDGSRILDDAVGLLQELHEASATAVDWRPGDVLVFDNRTLAHSRLAYEGIRTMLIACAGSERFAERTSSQAIPPQAKETEDVRG